MRHRRTNNLHHLILFCFQLLWMSSAIIRCGSAIQREYLVGMVWGQKDEKGLSLLCCFGAVEIYICLVPEYTACLYSLAVCKPWEILLIKSIRDYCQLWWECVLGKLQGTAHVCGGVMCWPNKTDDKYLHCISYSY